MCRWFIWQVVDHPDQWPSAGFSSGLKMVTKLLFVKSFLWFSGSLSVSMCSAGSHCMHLLHIVLVNHLSHKCHVTNHPAFITSWQCWLTDGTMGPSLATILNCDVNFMLLRAPKKQSGTCKTSTIMKCLHIHFYSLLVKIIARMHKLHTHLFSWSFYPKWYM